MLQIILKHAHRHTQKDVIGVQRCFLNRKGSLIDYASADIFNRGFRAVGMANDGQARLAFEAKSQ
ncbi:hypothetical protein D3C74_486200 [compost metagenome]